MTDSSLKAFCFRLACCWNGSKSIESDYDPRFGAPNITAPNSGAYSNPQYNFPSTAPNSKSPRVPENLTKSHLSDLKSERSKVSPTFSHGTTMVSSPVNRSQPASPFTPNSANTNMSVPVHEAFIPGERHTVQTISIPSPANSPPASPPASPPLPTPTSTRGGGSLLPKHAERYSQNPGLQDTMSRHQQVIPSKIRIPIEKRVQVAEPSPVESIELWPGSM